MMINKMYSILQNETSNEFVIFKTKIIIQKYNLIFDLSLKQNRKNVIQF